MSFSSTASHLNSMSFVLSVCLSHDLIYTFSCVNPKISTNFLSLSLEWLIINITRHYSAYTSRVCRSVWCSVTNRTFLLTLSHRLRVYISTHFLIVFPAKALLNSACKFRTIVCDIVYNLSCATFSFLCGTCFFDHLYQHVVNVSKYKYLRVYE